MAKPRSAGRGGFLHRGAGDLLDHAEMAGRLCLPHGNRLAGFSLFVGLASLGIAFLTVSFHAIRTALSNPTDSLRYE